MPRIIFAATLVILLTGVYLPATWAQDTPAVATLPANEGIVVSSLDTAGYTYMELVNGGKTFWIAAPTTKVKNGDHIRFVENMTMHNFTSKTLNRTFNQLIFVTSTQVKVAK